MIGDAEHIELIKDIYNFASWPPADDVVPRDILQLQREEMPLAFIERIPFFRGYQDTYGDINEQFLLIRVQQFPSALAARESFLRFLASSMSPRLPLGHEVGLDIGDISVVGHSETHLAITFVRSEMMIAVESVGEVEFPVDAIAQKIDEILK
jgi:hypothetical protein